MQGEVSGGFTAQRCRPRSVTISNSSLWSCGRRKNAKAWQEGGEREAKDRKKQREREGGKEMRRDGLRGGDKEGNQ